MFGRTIRKPIAFDTTTDAGMRSGVNQDAVFSYAKDGFGVFCVADGMGGHLHGEKASQKIVSSIKDWVEEKGPDGDPWDKLIDSFEQVIKEANESLFTENGEKQICGSTLIALVIQGINYAVLSVGDSRIYTENGRDLIQINKDDVWQSQPHVIAALKENEIKEHPNFGKLTKAIGVDEIVSLNIITGRIEKMKTFLLCSDGVYKYCREDSLRRTIHKAKKAHDKEKTNGLIEQLKQEICNNKAPDNYSLILVTADEKGLLKTC